MKYNIRSIRYKGGNYTGHLVASGLCKSSKYIFDEHNVSGEFETPYINTAFAYREALDLKFIEIFEVEELE